MKYTDIKRYLKPYEMHARRKTTINHAFAAAVASHDIFDDRVVRIAISDLGQDPDADLMCVYCESEAETWDHVFATVEKSQFSGAGHRLGNLLPCCKPCNSRKGNRPWETHLAGLKIPEQVRAKRAAKISKYIRKYFSLDPLPAHLPEYKRLIEIRNQIIESMKVADKLAAAIRAKMKPATGGG